METIIKPEVEEYTDPDTGKACESRHRSGEFCPEQAKYRILYKCEECAREVTSLNCEKCLAVSLEGFMGCKGCRTDFALWIVYYEEIK